MSTKLATVVADFTTQLTTQLDIGGTIATLQSATDDDGVALPSGVYFFTLDGANSQKEHIVATLSGTSLTAISSVSRQGVETSGAVRLHRVGAQVTITDFAHLYFINALVGGRALFDAAHPLEYDGAATITGVNQLATVQYVLDHVNGGAVSISGLVVAATAGETFSAGQPVYLKSTDSRWYKALANDSTITGNNIKFGIALGAGSSGVTITGGVAIAGLVSTLSGLTANTVAYISDTGTIATSAGTYSLPIGIALSTTSVLLFASPTLPSVAEKSAFAGSQGIPGPSNKFLTQDNVYNADTDQTQTTQNGTVEVGEADATTKKNLLAQSFTAGKTKIRGVSLYKSANTGTFTGNVKIALQADTTGSPSGSDLASVTITNAAYLALSTGEFQAIFSAEYASLVVGSLYWIVVTPSTSDTSNHPNLGTNTAGGYGSGSVKYKNTTDGWVAIATIDLYFKTLEGTIGQIGPISNKQIFPVSGTWVKPTTLSGNEIVLIQLWGGGGGGGGNPSSGGTNTAGGGGGGGAYSEIRVRASQLSSTVAVTIGAGGAGGIGDNVGAVGGNTTFGSYLTAYGGGGGGKGVSGGTAGHGGGGGGGLSVGIVGGNGGGTGGAGGSPNGGAAGVSSGLGGAGGDSGAAGNSMYGGGGGGSTQIDGGTSIMGGGGGGGGAGSASSIAPGAGGVSQFGGAGGAGAGINAGTGNAGVAPSGGGGGSSHNTNAATGGAGAPGQAIITVIY